jgi:ribonuclease Y
MAARLKEHAVIEQRLMTREELVNGQLENLVREEKVLRADKEQLAAKTAAIENLQAQALELAAQRRAQLAHVSKMGENEVRAAFLKEVEQESLGDAVKLSQHILEDAKAKAEENARKIISLAIQRYAGQHSFETSSATVSIKGEEMKGRIIGREGRNIRAFEKATGLDVVVDDTPGVVVISGFDGVRREMARRAMEKLVRDGRIHPARIEEVVEQTKKEMEQVIVETGKSAAFDVGLHNLHPMEIECLGRLKFRASYGQNQLEHSVEVAHLAGTMAAELGLDEQLAKRCGLLHDIGKSADQEAEGAHPQIGAEIARKCGEPQEVIDSIAAHHDDIEAANIYVVLVSAADAISAARPGARRETLEKYVKRLQRLEEIAGAFPGVEVAYAIRAGREVRVIVQADRVDDKVAAKMCRDIAKEIEAEMTYPGEVKVTLIRESRFVEVAH